MDTSTVAILAVVALVVLAGVVLLAAARRNQTQKAIGVLSRETRSRDSGAAAISPREEGKATASGRELELAAKLERSRSGKELVTAGSAAPTAWVPPDPDTLGATRRQFLNRGITGFFVVGLSGFGAACIAFLWPQVGGGFGSTIDVGNVTDVISSIRDNNGFLYQPEGRMWITEYPTSALEKAEAVYSDSELAGMEAGVVALYQKCPHLGCRVPECVTSQWFECPCHGSQYNQVGEKKGGPAPRGLDRFAMSVSNGRLSVDTGTIIQGPPIGTNTTGQEAEGPNCISAASDH
ncbi:MAG TPA: Rieske 2Fe-2S domain-containing protein [Acidimicrobiales bacterium]|nr:Rieske 2Fe-2S domain-containing protein [Acidimicrobiales bacterium]